MISWSCGWQRVDTMSSSSVAHRVSAARVHGGVVSSAEPHRPRTAAHSRGCTIPQTPCLTRDSAARRILDCRASCGGAAIARRVCACSLVSFTVASRSLIARVIAGMRHVRLARPPATSHQPLLISHYPPATIHQPRLLTSHKTLATLLRYPTSDTRSDSHTTALDDIFYIANTSQFPIAPFQRKLHGVQTTHCSAVTSEEKNGSRQHNTR
jgi:hypothetical protein